MQRGSAERYGRDAEQAISDAYLQDLAVQVSANSVITLRKYKIFNVGATMVVISLLILLSDGVSGELPSALDEVEQPWPFKTFGTN